MSWHQVFIQNGEVAAASAASLMDKFSALYRAAGVPAGVEIFHGRTNGVHVYFFSPNAAAVAADLLSNFNATALANKPNVVGCRKIEL